MVRALRSIAPLTLALITALFATGCSRSAPRVTLEAVAADRVKAELGLLPPKYGLETFIYEVRVDDVSGKESFNLDNVSWTSRRPPTGSAAFMLGGASEEQAREFWGQAPGAPGLPEGPVVLGTAPRMRSFVEGFFDTVGRVTAATAVVVASPALTLGGALGGQPTLAFDLMRELAKVGPQPVGDPSTTLLTEADRLAEYERLLRDWNQRLEPWQRAVRASSDSSQRRPWLFVKTTSRNPRPLDLVVGSPESEEPTHLEFKLSATAAKTITLENLAEHRTEQKGAGEFPFAEQTTDADRAAEAALGPINEAGRHLGDGADETQSAWRAHKLHPRRLDSATAARMWKARREADGDLEAGTLFCRVKSKKGGGGAQWVHGFTRRFVTTFSVKGTSSTVLLPQITLLRGEKVRFSIGRSGWFETQQLGDALATFDGTWPLIVTAPAWTATCFVVEPTALEAEVARIENRLSALVDQVTRASPAFSSKDYVKVKDAGRDARALIKELRFGWNATAEKARGWAVLLEAAESEFLRKRDEAAIELAAKAPATVHLKREKVSFALCPGAGDGTPSWKLVTAWDKPKGDKRRPWIKQAFYFTGGIFTPVIHSRRHPCANDDNTEKRELLCGRGAPPVFVRVTPATGKKSRVIALAKDGPPPALCSP